MSKKNLIPVEVENNRGFTLIEALIAMAIFAIGIVALYTMQVGSVTNNSKSARITAASAWSENQVEQVVGLTYKNIKDCSSGPAPHRCDSDGDGTGKDINRDGVDDSGNGFGLDDVDAAADGTSTSPDGVYTTFWNVALDVPMPDTATIKVIVRDNRNLLSPPVTVTYIKLDDTKI